MTLFILLLAWQIGTEFQNLTRDNIIIGETTIAGGSIQSGQGGFVSVEGRRRSLSPTQFANHRGVGTGNTIVPISSHDPTYLSTHPLTPPFSCFFVHVFTLVELGLPLRKGLRPGEVGYDGYDLGFFEGVFDGSEIGDNEDDDGLGSILTTSTTRNTWKDSFINPNTAVKFSK